MVNFTIAPDARWYYSKYGCKYGVVVYNRKQKAKSKLCMHEEREAFCYGKCNDYCKLAKDEKTVLFPGYIPVLQG